MKTSAALVFLSSLALLPAAHAQVHKCIAADSIVYRDTPCADGERALVLPVKPVNARAEPGNSNSFNSVHGSRTDATRIQAPGYRPGAATPQVDATLQAGWRSILPAAGTPISLGMSDLEVLNLRGWGRPSKITRSKANGVWREEWLYTTRGDGPRQLLQFTNARLAAIETEPADTAQQQVVHLITH